jgi:peptide/nickel transport system substrate-binding protein
MNQEHRLGLIREALLAQNAEVNLLPLHRQVIPWASRANVSIPHRADNNVSPQWATVK